MSFQDPDDRQRRAEEGARMLEAQLEATKRAGWKMKCHAECAPGLRGLEVRSKLHGHASNGRWHRWVIVSLNGGVTGSGKVFADNPERAMELVRDDAIHDNVARPYKIEIARDWLVEDVSRIATKEVE